MTEQHRNERPSSESGGDYDQPQCLSICFADDKSRSLFSPEVSYVVPMYQRDFAWTTQEVKTLLDDIWSIEESVEESAQEYFLGSLMVSERKSEDGITYFEVVDGQQRLTALCLLFIYLNSQKQIGGNNNNNGQFLQLREQLLSYEYREKTVKNFNKIINYALNQKEDLEIVTPLDEAYNEIEQFFGRLKKPDGKVQEILTDFEKNLAKVRILRVVLPKKTDLVTYYERMNTTSEQLEPVDIVKAKLMGCIGEAKIRERFALIWSACADMTRYVQMGIREVKVRDELFGGDWSRLNVENVKKYVRGEIDPGEEHETSQNSDGTDNQRTNSSLESIISAIRESEAKDKEMLEQQGKASDEEGRFESIIAFPDFLMHALNVFAEHCEQATKLGKGLKKRTYSLDDAVLPEIFDQRIDLGRDFAVDFIECLLKVRFLFDAYIIKRDYQNGSNKTQNDDRDWTIQSLKAYEYKNSKSPDYVNTGAAEEKSHIGSDEGKKPEENIKNRMIQACLRVSYTSPKSMHWITKVLSWLYKKSEDTSYGIISMWKLCSKTESIAANAVWEQLPKGVLSKEELPMGALPQEELSEEKLPEVSQYSLGVGTPHIVFHFLDYLLWIEGDWTNDKKLFGDFKFQFRDSVEHWYPQKIENLAEDNGNEDKVSVDDFGNLAIVSQSLNSKLRNRSPNEKAKLCTKKDSKTNILKAGNLSLKLREMIKLTEENKKWDSDVWLRHEQKMLDTLKSHCQSMRQEAK